MSEAFAGARPDTSQWVICGRCHALRGPIPLRNDGVVQLCACQLKKSTRLPSDWGGDFNTYAELCRCCGLRLLKSGSRWSVWFCDYCKPLISALNRHVGRCVIPIGRHSLMNGYALRPGGRDEATRIEAFVAATQGLAAGVQSTQAYARDVVAANVKALGYRRGKHVNLGEYLRKVEEANLQPAPAVIALTLHRLVGGGGG